MTAFMSIAALSVVALQCPAGIIEHKVRIVDANNMLSVMKWAQTSTGERSVGATDMVTNDETDVWILDRRTDNYWKIQTNEDDIANRHCLQVSENLAVQPPLLPAESTKVLLGTCDNENQMQRWRFRAFSLRKEGKADQTGYWVFQPGDYSDVCMEPRGSEYYIVACDPNAFDSIFFVEML